MAQIDLRNATIRISDGGSNHIDVKIGEGNLEYAEKRNIELVKSRGELDTVRENEEEAVTVSTQFIWEHITAADGEDITVEDALKRKNGASAWASASTDSLAPYSVNLLIIYQPVCSSELKETILLAQFNYTELAHSLKDGTVALTGTCNITEASTSRG